MVQAVWGMVIGASVVFSPVTSSDARLAPIDVSNPVAFTAEGNAVMAWGTLEDDAADTCACETRVTTVEDLALDLRMMRGD